MGFFRDKEYFNLPKRDASPTDYQAVRWSCLARGCDMPASRSDPSTGTPLCLQHRRRLIAERMRAPQSWSRDVVEACNVLGICADDMTFGAIRQRAQFLLMTHSAGHGEAPLGETRARQIEMAEALLLGTLESDRS